MTGKVLVLRPEPGLSETLASARKLRLDCIGDPLFKVEARDWDCPDPAVFDGLLIGSANAIRHGGVQLDRLRHLPVFAVGARTAEVASEAGFIVAVSGSGGLQNLLEKMPKTQVRLLQLSGAERVALDAPEDIAIEEHVVYEAMPQRLCETSKAILTGQSLVLLHSAAAASHFAAECDRTNIERGNIALAALGPRIAEAAGAGWAEIRTASVPNDRALLALVRDMWQ